MLIRKIKLSDLKKCAEILEKSYSKPPYNDNFQATTLMIS